MTITKIVEMLNGEIPVLEMPSKWYRAKLIKPEYEDEISPKLDELTAKIFCNIKQKS